MGKVVSPTPTPSPAGRPPVQSATQIQAQANQRGGLLGLQPNKLKVWLPGQVTRENVLPNDTGYFNKPTTRIKNVVDASEHDMNDVLNMVYDPTEAEKILAELQARGIEVSSFDDLEKIWKTAVSRAAKVYTYSHIEKSPWDMLDLVSNKQKGDGGPPNFPWRGKNYTDTHVTKTIDEIGPETAKGILTQSLQKLLGRDPTQAEIEDFASRANAIVGANPQVTTTSTQVVWNPDKYGPGKGGYEDGDTTSKTTGGSSTYGAEVQSAADELAKNNDEYGAFQAATTYSNMLFNAIASPVG